MRLRTVLFKSTMKTPRIFRSPQRLGLFILSLGFTAAFGQTTTDTYVYTGAPEYWTVPICVNEIEVTARGAQGGGANGGLGAEVYGIIPVTTGDVLEINVGGQGTCDDATAFGGGGAGYLGSGGGNEACGGGGATDLRFAPYGLGDRVIVAAGGGGMGGGNTDEFGGFGGCATGGTGTTTWGGPGSGGTSSAGGAGGAPWGGGAAGAPGGLGFGGDGGDDICYAIGGGGGGGGGYYGGGGGGSDCYAWGSLGGGGGGGGSSLTPTGGTCDAGVNSGDGSLTIEWVPAAPIGGVTDALPPVICDGETTNITVVGYNGTIQWESAPTSGGPFVPVAGETTDNWITPPLSADVCYRAEINSCGFIVYSDTICVTVNPLPIIDAGPDFTICEGDGATLTAINPDGAGLTWDGGVTDGVGFDPPLGVNEYTVTADLLGCISTDSMFLTVNPYPFIDAGPDLTLCDGDLATLTAINPDGAVISWDMGVVDGTGFIPPVGTTTYEVTADLIGCISYDDMSILVNPLPAIGAGPDQVLCETESTEVFGSGAGSTGSYAWSHGVVDGVSFTPPVGTITYTVTGTDANGCQNTDEMDITVNPLPQISFVADNVIGCAPFTIEFTNTTDLPGVDCHWYFGDGDDASGCTTVMNKYKDDGVYDVTLIVTTTDGCTDTTTYEQYITIIPYPEAHFGVSDQEVTIVDPAVQFVNSSLYHTTSEWNFGDGSPTSDLEDATHTFPDDPNKSYPVTLTVWNELGCSDSLTKLIIVKDVINFFIPNVFTPDGDEFNEVFKPIFDTGYDPYDFNMKIFNKYGEVIFESYNASVGWDGTYGSRGLVEDGVYVWSIEFKETMSDQRHKHRGHVTILK